MNYEQELKETLQTLKDIELALNESSIVAITNQRGTIQFANDKFCQISQYTREELIGSKQNIVNSGYHSREFFKNMWRTIGTGNVWKGEIRNQKKDGTFYWVDTTIVPFLKENGKPYKYISIRHDITKRKKYEETIKQMAFYDPLTLLPNRNALTVWLNNDSMKVGDTITVLFMDIDRFKAINDNFGHRTGDIILKKVAKRLQNCLHPSDFIVRQGGDEFIVFLKYLNDQQDIMAVVNKIKDQFALPFFVTGKKITTTTSIGISMNTIEEKKDNNLDFVEATIRQADTAMYHAKRNGGNSHCFNTRDQNNEMERYYKLDQEIKYALGQNEFSVVYHPLVRLKDNEVTGVEALLRWKNPNLGSVSPAEFIPILEELGLIIPVGKWVLKEVCKQMKSWHDKGVRIKRVSVNVSPIQFRNHNFVQDLKEILQETGLEAKYLEVEITEGTILNIKHPEKTLFELRDLGVSISIDDFGTGYSSLSYLKRLPVDTIKIDKSFIDDLDFNGEVIVDTIISMGKNLKYNIVAEGIESEAQANYLKNQNCQEGQGYYWSRPIEPEKITELYKEKILPYNDLPVSSG